MEQESLSSVRRLQLTEDELNRADGTMIFHTFFKKILDRIQQLQSKLKVAEKEAEDSKRELQLLQSGSDSHHDKSEFLEAKLRETKVAFSLIFFVIFLVVVLVALLFEGQAHRHRAKIRRNMPENCFD